MKHRTSRKQIENLLSRLNDTSTEYRLVSHQHLGNSASYSYTYSVCIYVDGKYERTFIDNTSLKMIAEKIKGVI